MSHRSYNQNECEQLSENEYPSDKSSVDGSGSDDDDPWWHREYNGHQGWSYRCGRQDNQNDRQDNQDGRQDNQHSRHGRQDNQHGRHDNQHGRPDSQHGRHDNQHGRQDNQHGRRDNQHWRQDNQHGRQDDRHGRQDDQHGRQDDRHGRQDEQHGRQDDQHGRQDEQHGRQDDQHGRQDDQTSHRHSRLPMSRIAMPTGKSYSITLPISTEFDCGVPTKRITLRPHGRIGRREYEIVKKEMDNTIRKHPPSLFTVDVFSRYEIIKIEKLVNGCLWKRYRNQRQEVKVEAKSANERMLFHGSGKVRDLVDTGFDERFSSMSGLFGAGLYFASDSSKGDQYVFGSTGCPDHGDLGCHRCERQMLLCRVILGKVYDMKTPKALGTAPPGFHSVKGLPGGVLEDPEYVVYRGEQVYPEYLITYKTKE